MVAKFKNVMETSDGRKRMIMIAVATVVILLLLWVMTRQ